MAACDPADSPQRIRVVETEIAGVHLLELTPISDHRGTFLRTYCRDALRAQGLDADIVQAALVVNDRRGTLRGLHYQKPPHAETKLVHCLTGALFDVVADIRPDSPTYGRCAAFELSGSRPVMLLVAPGCAHGYQTLADKTIVWYGMSTQHEPEAEDGIRFDDPRLAIRWPLAKKILSPRDRDLPPTVW